MPFRFREGFFFSRRFVLIPLSETGRQTRERVPRIDSVGKKVKSTDQPQENATQANVARLAACVCFLSVPAFLFVYMCMNSESNIPSKRPRVRWKDRTVCPNGRPLPSPDVLEREYITVRSLSEYLYSSYGVTDRLTPDFFVACGLDWNKTLQSKRRSFQHTLRWANASDDERAAHSLSVRMSWTPERRASHAEEVSARYLNPEYGVRVVASQKLTNATPETKQRRSDSSKEVWSRPGMRDAAVERGYRLGADPDIRKKKSDSMRAVCSDPEYLRGMSERSVEIWKRPGLKERAAAARLTTFISQEYVTNMRSMYSERLESRYPLTDERKVFLADHPHCGFSAVGGLFGCCSHEAVYLLVHYGYNPDDYRMFHSNLEREMDGVLSSFFGPGVFRTNVGLDDGTRDSYDFVSDSFRTVIEVNGSYWHSELEKREPGYHERRRELVKSVGYRLYEWWDDGGESMSDFVSRVHSELTGS